MTTNTKHALSDEDITRIWDGFRTGKSTESIAKATGVKADHVDRVTSAILEVYADDVADMIEDRKAGMTKSAIAEKYGYTLAGVRYYLQGIPKGEPEPAPHHMTFAEEWEAACRKLNPKAWEILERRMQREEE